LSDVHVPDIPGMFTTFKANNVPLFVDGQQVSDVKKRFFVAETSRVIISYIGRHWRTLQN
jgi:hypothetical protein